MVNIVSIILILTSTGGAGTAALDFCYLNLERQLRRYGFTSTDESVLDGVDQGANLFDFNRYGVTLGKPDRWIPSVTDTFRSPC